MADVCPDCGRPTDRGEHEGMSWCIVRGSHSCMIVADAYQRGRRDGIDEGVRIAKALDVLSMLGDAAAEKAKGE